jgi:FGGY-family pentulose kinase
VHRATGTDARSLCSAVCKWTYLGHRGISGEGWDDGFLERIGLGDLAAPGHHAIGNRFRAAGECAGRLSAKVAEEMGLPAGISVSTALIDGYSGALGTLGAKDTQGSQGTGGRLALIAGTSTCHICLTPDPVFIPGIWGPYFSVLLPGLWANEGGQSAAGALVDAVIARHSAAAELPKGDATAVAEFLERHLGSLSAETATLTADRHVQPDFHGNRSPLAEAWRKGAVSGLTLDHGLDDLALDYLATVQALAYGTRHIVDGMKTAGIAIDTLVVSGGLARNRLYLREHADATACRILVPDQSDPSFSDPPCLVPWQREHSAISRLRWER